MSADHPRAEGRMLQANESFRKSKFLSSEPRKSRGSSCDSCWRHSSGVVGAPALRGRANAATAPMSQCNTTCGKGSGCMREDSNRARCSTLQQAPTRPGPVVHLESSQLFPAARSVPVLRYSTALSQIQHVYRINAAHWLDSSAQMQDCIGG